MLDTAVWLSSPQRLRAARESVRWHELQVQVANERGEVVGTPEQFRAAVRGYHEIGDPYER